MATNPMPTYKADDVLHLPIPPGILGYELVDGELVEVMPGGQMHGFVAGEVFARIRGFIRDRHIKGRCYVDAGFALGLRRDPERLRGPDVSFVTAENLERYGGGQNRGFIHGRPDLAVEIESAERPKAMQQRIQDYLDAGTPLVWVIHLETNAATVYHTDGSAQLLRESHVLDGEDVLPGLQIPLRDLFEEN